MTENRENWLYPDASGLYFSHDGFVMRASDGKQYDYEEECELLNKYDKKYNEYRNDVLRLEKENEQLKADNNRLVNETARIVAEHQGRVLDLIDKSLEKDKQYYEMNYEDYLNGRIEALEELKKELQE